MGGMTARSLFREGLLWSLAALAGRPKGVRAILMYHSVGGRDPHSISADKFAQQLSFLCENFKVVPLRELPQAVRRYGDDINLVSITFDDGYLDNYKVALPILECHGVKATFFIATGFLSAGFPGTGGMIPMMEPPHVRELGSLGHEIGAHTVSHRKLTRLPDAEAAEEIRTSKAFLEDLLGGETTSFAYPKGDYDARVKQLVGEAGFRRAVTIRPGLVGSEIDWLALPRIWVSGALGLENLRARLSPGFTLFVKLKERARLRGREI